ncbi:hypothetical protein ABIF65_005581 [Bradyrhizobium japonicum]|uniref:hypothetical protein n=1 Tax=Bradyrhizobium TaxID=374 RepID=UPI000426F0DA|nr:MULTISPECIES: hypothetical protein [Bradyrhizobium]MCP1743909.1 hypothetical protein [Bradyrhizobium japonicum]MCP1782204.1 hypothetical protein [Bradyrhizobium japonicum]MCP1861624.1 hypothetical protein [Bradyrhizobium japonicum]MCP1892383.1 hypothetical protein [Bradyrhizobium japonicum]MCP1965508.1 hypothetical protein [Bradyrhizobium japonicum]
MLGRHGGGDARQGQRESEKRPDGTLVLRSPIEFETPKWSILDFIPEWAEKAPQRTFLAQRGRDGEWQGFPMPNYGKGCSR